MAPAVSEKQRKMFAVAAYAPEKLYAKNRGVLGMKKKQLHEFAKTTKGKLGKR